MARFTVNTTRFDPYLGFKFKVKWDGQYVAGLNKCSALKRTTEVTPWYEGGDSSGPHQIPGGLLVGRGHPHRHHLVHPQQLGQMLSVAGVGLHPIPGRTLQLRRRRHHTAHPGGP